MVECEECGEECKRRTRCKSCGEMRCGYCLHHFHNRVAHTGTLAQSVEQPAFTRHVVGSTPAGPTGEES